MDFTADIDERAKRRLWRRVARTFLPEDVRRHLSAWFVDLMTPRRSDRIFLVRELIPSVGRRGGKTLFVGCRKYTKRYPALFAAQGAECWTIDIDPEAARWGAPKRHVTGDIKGANDHWPPSSFTTIVMSGVFGFGLNSLEDQNTALRVCHALLAKDGCLILGWNFDRCADPSELSALRSYFRPASIAGLTGRRAFKRSKHVFEPFTVVSPPQISE